MKKKINEKHIKIAFIILIFIFTLIISINIKEGNAPDEGMKRLVCEYIQKHSALPLGNDPEVVNQNWGTSYAFTPILSYIISAIFMKFVTLFSSNSHILTIAARFTSVLCYTGTAVMTIKIGDILFEKKKFYKWLFIILVTFLPQFIFLGAYINNDSIAVFSTSIIVYSWLIGLKSNWNNKSIICLGIGIGICALSYYNAYGYILTSLILFIFGFIINKKDKFDYKKFLKKFLIVFLISFAIAGWWFIRSYIVYDGDFLGLNASNQCAEELASDDLKPSNLQTPHKKHESIIHMITKSIWTKQMIRSFIGSFGSVSISLPNIVYLFYYMIFMLGMIGGIIYIIKNFISKIYKENKILLIIEIIFVLNIIIPNVLNLYYSYFSDFQPQGRYSMPMLIPFMYFITLGLKEILERILNIKLIKEKLLKNTENKKVENIIVLILIVVLIIISLVFLPRACK